MNTFAQTPDGFSYQAVIRDSSGNLVTDSPISVEISILEGSAIGTKAYTESHTVNTNANGILSLVIGNGNVILGDLSTIDWSADDYFIRTDTDITGGTNYTIQTVTQLLSVPYALHAKTATTVTQPVLMEPYILGRSNHVDNGTWNFGGKTGWEAANEACKASYPNEPYARAFTNEQITQAIVLGNYSDNQNYNNVSFWAITSAPTNDFTNAPATQSIYNNAFNLNYQAGTARGTRATITFNATIDNGNQNVPRVFNVQTNIGANQTYPCLCGTYKPAE